jgi:hypothetical protein
MNSSKRCSALSALRLQDYLSREDAYHGGRCFEVVNRGRMPVEKFKLLVKLKRSYEEGHDSRTN